MIFVSFRSSLVNNLKLLTNSSLTISMGRSLQSSCYLLLAFSSLISVALSAHPEGDLASRNEALPLLPRANSKNVRLMPLGDSITVGVGSSDGNGWRLDLENMLTYAGYTPDFVGSHDNGTNDPDDQNEGFGGYWIYDILKTVVADQSLYQRPNLVILMAGTNDMTWADTSDTAAYANAPARLGNLIDYVLCEVPDAVVLVGTLILNVVHQTEVDTFNSHIPEVVQQRVDQGYKLQIVDQSQVPGPVYLHPNDDGYKTMAANYFNAINNLPDNWLDEPTTSTGTPQSDSCTPSYDPPLPSGGVLSRRVRRQIFEEAVRRDANKH